MFRTWSSWARSIGVALYPAESPITIPIGLAVSERSGGSSECHAIDGFKSS